MYFVRGHYRKPIDYSSAALDQARRSVERVRELARRLDPDAPPVAGADALERRFYEALADDFNTPQALSVVFELVAEANRRLAAGESGRARAAARHAVDARPRQPARGR